MGRMTTTKREALRFHEKQAHDNGDELEQEKLEDEEYGRLEDEEEQAELEEVVKLENNKDNGNEVNAAPNSNANESTQEHYVCGTCGKIFQDADGYDTYLDGHEVSVDRAKDDIAEEENEVMSKVTTQLISTIRNLDVALLTQESAKRAAEDPIVDVVPIKRRAKEAERNLADLNHALAGHRFSGLIDLGIYQPVAPSLFDECADGKTAKPHDIRIFYKCYLCTIDRSYETPHNLRRHLAEEHSVTVPPRRPGQRMKNTDLVTYIVSASMASHPDMIENVACPSCCFSCERLVDLKEHVNSHIHDEDQPLDSDNDSSERARKRPRSVSIVGEKQIYTFSAALDLPPSNCPKVPDDVLLKLQEIITVPFPTNKHLNVEQRTLVAEEEAAQQSLSTLKGFEMAFKFLCNALV
ncbi:hypothetical protein BGX34_005437 [Mortierella sp. NVP85]|nr:hypothetical protein BGX34_005437 [Mortierella sp. NVP85]